MVLLSLPFLLFVFSAELFPLFVLFSFNRAAPAPDAVSLDCLDYWSYMVRHAAIALF